MEGQDANKELKLLLDVIAVTTSDGTDCNAEQPLNILFIFVAAAVSSSGIARSELQLLNMKLIFVTAAVFKGGIN